ncbi:hypothetical protein ABKV19_015471 [Rosa sericea]
MGEANEGRRRAMESLTFQMDKYPRDLLQRLMCRNDTSQSKYEEGNEEEELELNLGLSLGGRFGVDKSEKSKLVRSSSIAVTMPFCREENDDSAAPASAAKAASYAGLMRASSLPTETEEEWRKRKELQTLRRLAAKRRRSEKQRNSSSSKEEEERRELEVRPTSGMRANNPAVVQPFWAAVTAARQAVGGGGGGVDPLAKGKNDILGGFQGFGLQPSSQGSVESQGGGSSSGLSEMESKPLQGERDGTKEDRLLLDFPYSFPLTSQDPAAVVKQEALLVIRTPPFVLWGH